VPRATFGSAVCGFESASGHAANVIEYNYKYTKFREGLIAYFPSYDTHRKENNASSNNSIVARAFLTAVTFLLSRCLGTIRRYRYRHKGWLEGYTKYAVEMNSGVIIYISSSIQIGSAIQELREGWVYTNIQNGYLISVFASLQNKASRPIHLLFYLFCMSANIFYYLDNTNCKYLILKSK
jgi:hypothetical protein